MAITFPRAFPAYCMAVDGDTRIVRQQSVAMTGGASPQGADLGAPYWACPYSFLAHGREQIAEMDAWTSSLRGVLRSFKGVPVRNGKLYRWPRLRPTGFAGLTVSASPWSGFGNLADIGETNDTITIDEMPNGLVLSAGDFLSFAVGSKQHLHQIIEGGTVSSNSVTVTVEPAVRPNAETAVAVTFEAPWCDMVVAGKVSKSEAGRFQARFSFDAVQALF